MAAGRVLCREWNICAMMVAALGAINALHRAESTLTTRVKISEREIIGKSLYASTRWWRDALCTTAHFSSSYVIILIIGFWRLVPASLCILSDFGQKARLLYILRINKMRSKHKNSAIHDGLEVKKLPTIAWKSAMKNSDLSSNK